MHWMEMAITVLASVFASSGFWAYFQARRDRLDSKTQMIVGLSHNMIIDTGMKYIQRGWITKDEYEDFLKYLYEPYDRFGGNGMAKEIKKRVDGLPMVRRGEDFYGKTGNDGSYSRDGSDEPFGNS